MRQVTRKKYREFLRDTNIELFEAMTEESPLTSVYEWRDAYRNAHARVTYLYAAVRDSEAYDIIYEIEDQPSEEERLALLKEKERDLLG